MSEVGVLRLNLLRALYAFVAFGLVYAIWPGILSHGPDVPLMNGVVSSLLGAVSLLALLGLRHPLQMIPVLLFELAWKLLWLTAFALPQWAAGGLDAATTRTVWECVPALLIVAILPWRYVVRHYLARPGDPWRASSAAIGGEPRR